VVIAMRWTYTSVDNIHH